MVQFQAQLPPSVLRRRACVSRFALCAALMMAAAPDAAFAQDADIESMVVSGRLPRAASDAVFSGIRLDRQDLETAPQLRIDDILSEATDFSLFRRTSSLVAHPTTQGATLRGVGPNGAGRALVTVDGVPQNDPFGGWVHWGRIAPAVVDEVDVLHGGSVGPYANAALSGSVRIHTRGADAPPAFLDGSVGNKGTVNAIGGVTVPVGRAHVFARGGHASTDGFYVLKEQNRGSVDRRVDSEMSWGEAGAYLPLDDAAGLNVKAAYFDENRGNGTPLAHNGTKGYDLSVGLVSYDGPESAGWEAHVFYQNRDFTSQFSSVADDRNSEAPALLQYDVPGTSFGGNAVGRLPVGDGLQLQIGADGRKLEGSTNERYFWSGSEFLRQRRAGGDQLFLGAFAEAIWEANDQVTATAGLRGDYWTMTDGMRREIDRETGEPLLDETFADRDDLMVNARAGIEYRPLSAYALNVTGYTGFRLPTINELYRPYRVRNDIVEANPRLAPERLYGAEIGLEATPLNTVRAGLTFFVNRVENAVANVELTTEPGFYAPLGVFVPEDGSLSQRLNLDRTLSRGIEASARVALSTGWALEARYFHVDSEVKKASVDPSLEGRALPQVAKNRANFSVIAEPLARWRGRVDLRLEGKQFDDLVNSRTLDNYATMDAYIGFALRENVELFGRIQNLFDADIETARSGGLTSYGQPRLWQLGVTARL